MPLAFDTLDHGEIAIGFFNIESDIFLIDNLFIFASDLCAAIGGWASGPEDLSTELEMYVIAEPAAIGDLMGAINGVRSTGFIGELYKLYPFPKEPDGFKQNPRGYETRGEVESLIGKYSIMKKVEVVMDKGEGTIRIGEYRFNRLQFRAVIEYIERGGMPMWKDGTPPTYVEEMMMTIGGSSHWLFDEGEREG